jgi:hypothetical protein
MTIDKDTSCRDVTKLNETLPPVESDVSYNSGTSQLTGNHESRRFEGRRHTDWAKQLHEIDWLFAVLRPSQENLIYGDVTIAGKGLQNLGLCLALRAFEQRGVFIVPHLLWHGNSVFPVASEGPPPFSRLLRHTRGCGGFFFWKLKVVNCPVFNAVVERIGLRGCCGCIPTRILTGWLRYIW